MKPLSPYEPPKADDEQERMMRSVQQPVRKAVFGTLFILLIVSLAIFGPAFGLIGGIVLALLGGGALTGLYNLTAPRSRPLNPALHSGEATCPACGSVQTDQVYGQRSDGTHNLRWRCFACDHAWAADADA